MPDKCAPLAWLEIPWREFVCKTRCESLSSRGKSEGRQLFLFYRQAYLHISLSLSLDSAFRASSSLGLTFLVGEAASKSGQGTHSVGFEEINELDGLGSGGGVRLLSSLVLDIASPSFLISDIRSPKLFDPLSEPESSLAVVEALAGVLGKNRC